MFYEDKTINLSKIWVTHIQNVKTYCNFFKKDTFFKHFFQHHAIFDCVQNRNFFKYINSGIKLDNSKYNQKFPHIYVMTYICYDIYMLWQSGWQITTFCHKIYIFGFHLLEAILLSQGFDGHLPRKFYPSAAYIRMFSRNTASSCDIFTHCPVEIVYFEI